MLGEQAGAVRYGALRAGMKAHQVTIGDDHGDLANRLRQQVGRGDWLSGQRLARHENGKGFASAQERGQARSIALLYHLSSPLSTSYSGFNVFRYITFRAAMAALLSLLISFLLGPWLIRVLTDKTDRPADS